MRSALMILLLILVGGCNSMLISNPADIEVRKCSAGSHFIKQATDRNWFANIYYDFSGATAIELFGDKKFIGELRLASFCNEISGVWNLNSCVLNERIVYVSYNAKGGGAVFYQQGNSQSYDDWLNSLEMIYNSYSP